MEDPNEPHQQTINIIKEALKNNDQASAARIIQETLEKQNNIPLNIGITGETGSGKSSFVNAFRGISDDDEGAAPTDCVETTTEVKAYPHPNYPNVILWDLPGIGTPSFPTDKYLELVGFQKFDFFIIVLDTRFRENNVKLAKEIHRMAKKYFVCSNIDIDLQYQKRRHKDDFNAQRTLAKIRKNCVQGLQQQGFASPQVFLISSVDLHLYDFSRLHKTLERDLPEHQRHALLLAMPNINPEIIAKKKKAFMQQIWFYAAASAAVAAAPVPGLSVDVDLGLLVAAVKQYVVGFGLDPPSLRRLAATTGVPFESLLAVITSPLAAAEINADLILKVAAQLSGSVKLTAAEEASRFIPLIGIPASMSLSAATTYKLLKHFVNILAEDAHRVVRRARGLDPSLYSKCY